ncbi:MAG: hypothetical protein DRP10_01485 [Candidatus Aenigmatarchaeota archaeon]|nr:MAG: hypothetical protein DRP10_01485 [Candidatus Aenigmarchaeota archaeon]
MAEELRKSGAEVAEYLRQMVNYTKQDNKEKAKEAYKKALDRLDEKSCKYLKNLEYKVGYDYNALQVAKAATKALKSYTKYINRKIEKLKKEQAKLEKAEEKFEELRAELE